MKFEEDKEDAKAKMDHAWNFYYLLLIYDNLN